MPGPVLIRLLLLLPAPVRRRHPAAAGFKSFANDLALGMKGDDVLRLQALLASDKEIYPEGTVSGYFGNLTAQAVKRFQTKYKLPSIGRVGPATRAKLAEIFSLKTLYRFRCQI